ncbi:hypothetical protein GF312_10715 [Candidatus Poribacteria bacterium]|nr:hypothetical protein [Candidatus Poribacteria bacterium]
MKVTCVAIVILLVSTSPLFGVSVSGSLTTMNWLRQEPIERNGEDLYNYLYEYIRVSIGDIADDSLSAYIYTRVRKDIASDGKPDWRTIYGYLNWTGPQGYSIKVGRQFLPNGLGFWQMDGIRVKFKSFRGISHSAYAGSSVAPWSVGENRDGLAGLSVDLPEILKLQTGLSLFANFDSKSFERVVIGGHLDSYDYSLFELRKFIMYSKINYDIINRELVQGSATVNLNLLEKFGIYSEYYHGKQLFPEESIFSVFATDDINEAAVGLRYNVFKSMLLAGRYSRYFSSSFPSSTFEIGLYRNRSRVTDFSITMLKAEKPDTDSMDTGIRASLGRSITKKFSAKISVYYNDYRLRGAEKRDNIHSLQLDLGYHIIDQISAHIRLEDNVDHNGDNSFRLLARVRLGFKYGQPSTGGEYGHR